jgi:hypothetical protein
MPGYIEKGLLKLQHKPAPRPQDSPHACTVPTYGTATKLTKPTDTSALFDTAGMARLPEIIGTLLHYYAHAIDSIRYIQIVVVPITAMRCTIQW